MPQPGKKDGDIPRLVRAGLLEAACVLGGAVAYTFTGKPIWILIGVLAGLGISLPVVIEMIRNRKEHDSAPR